MRCRQTLASKVEVLIGTDEAAAILGSSPGDLSPKVRELLKISLERSRTGGGEVEVVSSVVKGGDDVRRAAKIV